MEGQELRALSAALAVRCLHRRSHTKDAYGGKHDCQKWAQAYSELRHPGICRLMACVFDEVSEHYMLAIEEGEEGGLFDQVANGALSEAVAHDYFAQIIDVVDYYHTVDSRLCQRHVQP